MFDFEFIDEGVNQAIFNSEEDKIEEISTFNQNKFIPVKQKALTYRKISRHSKTRGKRQTGQLMKEKSRLRQRNPKDEIKDQSENLFLSSSSINQVDIPINTLYSKNLNSDLLMKHEQNALPQAAKTASNFFIRNGSKHVNQYNDYDKSIFNEEGQQKLLYRTGGISPKFVKKKQIKLGSASGHLHLLRYSKSIPKLPKHCKKCTLIYGPEAYCQCTNFNFDIKILGQKLKSTSKFIKPEVGINTGKSLNGDFHESVSLSNSRVINGPL